MSSPEIVEEGKALPAPAKKSKKKLIIIGAAAGVLVLGGGGGAAAFMLGGSKAEAAEEGGHAAKPAAKKAEGGGHGESGGEGEGAAFVDVPPMIVNLRSPDGQARFLKIHFMIVPGENGSEDSIKEQLPVLLDSYQPFLRELRPEDLGGSAAVFRVKEEMMTRANAALGEGMVKDILIQDLVQQ
jgi:flagellar protein FliL